MPLYDLLLPEFDDEIRKTRSTLERIPENIPDFKPHEKSTAFAKLASHTAGLPGFLSIILTAPELDISTSERKPSIDGSREELLAAFDASAAVARAQLAETADRAMHENWKLCSGKHNLFAGSRYHAVRTFFFSHMVHHRAQLGVYLRLNGIAVPSIYGPSADES